MPIQPINSPTQISDPIYPPPLHEIQPIDIPVAANIKNVNPEVVIVVGADYPSERGVDITDKTFSKYCDNIAPKLNKKYPGVKITIFNFGIGTLRKCKVSNRGNLLDIQEIENLGKLSMENYRYVMNEGDEAKEKYVISRRSGESLLYFPGISDAFSEKDATKKGYLTAFRDGKLKEKSISISHVYNYIEKLGRNSKGSLVELHIFSHAYEIGPILANTSWFDNKYLDKDGRIDDFDSKTTVIKKMNDFKAAFAKEALLMVWGCNLYYPALQIIIQTKKSENYSKMRENPKEPMLILSFSKDWRIDTEDEFHKIVQDTHPYPKGNESQKKSLSQIVKILQRIMDYTYMKKLAKATGKNVLGALPGTYADMDNPKNQKKFGTILMHIPMGKKYIDYISEDHSEGFANFTHIMKFYRDNLKVQFKPDGDYNKVYGRGYAIYRP